jgi:hypothetical protein
VRTVNAPVCRPQSAECSKMPNSDGPEIVQQRRFIGAVFVDTFVDTMVKVE